jgi:hypothetical protein
MKDEDEHPIDKIIREARESGAFENLPGKGKPIQWDDESLVPEHLRMANRVLKESGYAPDWIEQGRELDRDFQTIHERLEQNRRVYKEGRLGLLAWREAVEEYQASVRALNLRVIGYNLRVPHERLQRKTYPIDPDWKPNPKDSQ